MRNGFKSKSIRNRDMVGLLYVLPWIIGFLAFSLIPLISSLCFSFTNYQLRPGSNFIGLDNYIRMFTRDPDFYSSLNITMVYALVSVLLKMVVALAVAMVLTVDFKLVGVYRTIFYLPSIFGGSVAIALLWRMLFKYNGLLNNILHLFSIKPVEWLTNPSLTLYTISFANVWMFGSSMILFLAALKGIPKYLYEAAKIDGSGRISNFLHVTLPQLTPIILFNLVMQTINAFQEFTGAFVITNGGPMKSTWLFSLHIYSNAFTDFQMGYASALSWALFTIILVFTLLLLKTSNSWVFYSGD